jgi:hypothetical protein
VATKHFFKTLIIFIGMIALGLIGVFLVSHYDIKMEAAKTVNTDCSGDKC